MKEFTRVLGGSPFAFVRAVLLIVGVVSVFVVLSIWAPVGVLLIALVVISFAGGASLGRGAVVLVPLTVVAIAVRAELVAAHPVKMQTFLLGGVVVVIALGGVALIGTQARRLLGRPSAGRRSNV